jgi:hypothetical protein
MRYYVKTDFDRNPLALFRFEMAPGAFAQEVWLPKPKQWAESKTLPKMLFDGEVSLYDISLENAKKVFPEAFVGPEVSTEVEIEQETPVVPNGS